jgi:hypothetical protein
VLCGRLFLSWHGMAHFEVTLIRGFGTLQGKPGEGGGIVGYGAQGELLKIGIVRKLDMIGYFEGCVRRGGRDVLCTSITLIHPT